MTQTLFQNVRIFDLAHKDGMTKPSDLRVSEGRISEIADRIEPLPEETVIAGNGNLLMPGLINGHFHSAVNHMKGRLPSLPLEIFMLYECPELEILRPTPREAYLRTMLGCIEMLRSGTTSVQDDCFFVPAPEPDIIDAVAQAYEDSGIRARLALDQPELSELEKLPFLRDILPADLRKSLSAPSGVSALQLLELYDHLINRWHGAAYGRIKAAVSCSAPQRVSPDYFVQLDDLSLRHDLPFYAHMLETRSGSVTTTSTCLRAPVPPSPIIRTQISGLAVGSCAINMWSVMKTASVIHNLTDRDYDRWPKATEVLHAATQGGGLAMREPELGQMVEGAPADLIMIDLKSLPFIPLNDLPRQLVHCECGYSIKLTMVAGQIVARDGKLQTIDEESILAEASAFFAGKKAAMDVADTRMAEVLPYYREMYARAGEYALGFEQHIPSEVGSV